MIPAFGFLNCWSTGSGQVEHGAWPVRPRLCKGPCDRWSTAPWPGACTARLDRDTASGQALVVGGDWAHGLWQGVARAASGQVLGAAASGQSSTQRLLVRYWAQRLRAEIRCNGFGLGSFFFLIPQLEHGLWPGVAQAWTARPDRDTASGQALVVGGGWAHGLWQGVARAASGQVLSAAALGQGSTQRLLVMYWAQRLRARMRRNGFRPG